MATDPSGRHHDGPGVQAYRWWVATASAGMVALCVMIYSTVKETANDVTTLKIGLSMVTATQNHQNLRLDGIERRNDLQDDKIGKLQEEFWRLPQLRPAPAPAPREPQRQTPFEVFPPR